MPRQRHPDNNPTERIQRLLDEYADWIGHVEYIENLLAEHYTDAIQYLPPRPTKETYAVECKHQQDHGQRNKRARKYMSLMRSASDGPTLGSMKQLKERAIAQKPSIPSWQKQILREIELEDAAKQPDRAELLEAAAANDEKIGLPPGVSIEPSEDALALEEDLKKGKLF